jgi:predicted alpha-1,6-mannanase (GH76 family)
MPGGDRVEYERINLDAQLRAHQAAQAARVSRQVLNYWRRDGGPLKPVDHDKAGHALYRLGDVLAVERDMRNAKQSTRRLVAA